MCDAFDILQSRKDRARTSTQALRGKDRMFVDLSRDNEDEIARKEQKTAVEQDEAKRIANNKKTQSERMGGRYVATVVDGDSEVFGQPNEIVKGSGNIDLPEALILRAQARDLENNIELIQDSESDLTPKNTGLARELSLFSTSGVVDRPATTVDLTRGRDKRTIVYQPSISDEEFCRRVDREATETVCDF